MKYITTITTKWYTTGGNVGGSLSAEYKFDSDNVVNSRRHETGTNRWIPSAACIVYTETPVPTPPVTPPDATYDYIEQQRFSYDGGITWTAWKYFGVKEVNE